MLKPHSEHSKLMQWIWTSKWMTYWVSISSHLNSLRSKPHQRRCKEYLCRKECSSASSFSTLSRPRLSQFGLIQKKEVNCASTPSTTWHRKCSKERIRRKTLMMFLSQLWQRSSQFMKEIDRSSSATSRNNPFRLRCTTLTRTKSTDKAASV